MILGGLLAAVGWDKLWFARTVPLRRPYRTLWERDIRENLGMVQTNSPAEIQFAPGERRRTNLVVWWAGVVRSLVPLQNRLWLYL